MAAPLILASTSRYRRELLARLEVPFEVQAPDYDEEAQRHRFAALGADRFALALARGKAASLRAAHPRAWILGADQIAVALRDGAPALLTKPGTPGAAVECLLELAGRSHDLVTAVVLDAPGGLPTREAVDHHRLRMRAFDHAEAEAYVAAHHPEDCVGAYRIEDAGIALFEGALGSDYTAIIGLPLMAVAKMLREAGLR